MLFSINYSELFCIASFCDTGDRTHEPFHWINFIITKGGGIYCRTVRPTTKICATTFYHSEHAEVRQYPHLSSDIRIKVGLLTWRWTNSKLFCIEDHPHKIFHKFWERETLSHESWALYINPWLQFTPAQLKAWKHILMKWEVLLTVWYISSEVMHKLISLSIHIHHRDDKVVRVRIEVQKVDNNRESAFREKQV